MQNTKVVGNGDGCWGKNEKVQRKVPTYFNFLVLNVLRRGAALPPVELVELVLVVLQLAESLHLLRSLLASVLIVKRNCLIVAVNCLFSLLHFFQNLPLLEKSLS